MPKHTKVKRCFNKLKKKRGKAAAARICQASTGQSLSTGKRIKRKAKR